jgi:hypothetical protein
VIVSSVVRGASLEEASGFLRVVDLDHAEVLATVAIPEARHLADDPNPRGGLRGGRGVSSHGERLAVASNDTVFVLDSRWRLRHKLTHPLAGGIHDIDADEDGVWISSTAGSMVLKLSWTGEFICGWHWAEDPELVRTLGFRPGMVPALDTARDYRIPAPGSAAHDVVHLNAVRRCGDRLLVGFGQVLTARRLRRERLRGLVFTAAGRLPAIRRGLSRGRAAMQRKRASRPGPAAPAKPGRHAIVSLELDGGAIAGVPAELIWHAEGARTPKHNLMPGGPEIVWFTDSDGGMLVEADTGRGLRGREIEIPGAPPFVRGLLRASAREVIVGSQRPAALHRVDLDAGAVVESVDLEGEPSETVYAVAAVPANFDPDPAGLSTWASPLGSDRERPVDFVQ